MRSAGELPCSCISLMLSAEAWLPVRCAELRFRMGRNFMRRMMVLLAVMPLMAVGPAALADPAAPAVEVTADADGLEFTTSDA
jgi:hypothetical protein